MERSELFKNVYLTYILSEKFKTGFLSAQMALPLRKETAHLSALLVNVLSRGTARCPNMRALGRELDLLYGAQLDASVRKKGENQVFGFMASCVEDRFLPGETRVLEPLAALLGEVLLFPDRRDGHLREDYFIGEKTNLSDMIRSEINDKRLYVGRRLREVMCANEPYGVGRLGEVENVDRATMADLEAFYHEVLPQARLELFYCGSESQERVGAALREAFSALPRAGRLEPVVTSRRDAPQEPRIVVEEMDVAQGKLCLGFRVGSSDLSAMLLMNNMLGGYTSSKLFRNVREKLSLCYYIGSTYHRYKGLLTISAGIEPDDYDRAVDAILTQIEDIRRGRWEAWELSGTKRFVQGSLRAVEDSARAIEDFAVGQAVARAPETLSGILTAIGAVTPDRIVAAAESVKLDTVYFLRGRGDENA